MDTNLEKNDWNALRTRSRHEKVVEKVLIDKKIVVYLPKLPQAMGCNGKRKEVERPLFPGYIFVKPRQDQVYALNFIPGTCGLLMERNRPGIVFERDMAAIRTLLSAKAPVIIHSELIPGTRVRVVAGPFSGIEGVLIGLKNNHRLAINTEILGQAVSVEINRNQIHPIQILTPEPTKRIFSPWM